MQLKSILIVAFTLFIHGVVAQSVVGTFDTPAASVTETSGTLTPLGPMIPDISIAPGWTLSGAVASGTPVPDVSVVGDWTATADDAYATHTVCYQFTDVGGVTETMTATPTIINGGNPSGYECYQVFATGGGVMWIPLPEVALAPSTNKGITVALPIVVSLVGLVAIIGGVLVFMRLRRRALVKANREWVNRPGGWADDATRVEEGTTAKY